MVRRRSALAETLRQRIFSGLHLGMLKPGDRLPGVRELARELAADPRVILAACRELEKEGLLELRQRSGIYVARATPASNVAARREADWVVEVLVEALSRDIPGPEFPEHLRQALETVRLRVACIECNRDQNAQLCGELSADYGLDTYSVDLFDLLSAPAPPEEVRRADLLVTSQFHAFEIQPLAEDLGKPLLVASLQPALFTGIAQLLTLGPVYFAVSDERFADKLRRIFATTPGGANFHPLVYGVHDLDQVPPDAPLYLSELVRELLPETSKRRLSLPHLRALAPHTARQLFSFIIRANMAASPAQG